ncbi:hypothetical protein Pelo_8679 [Pelomyxa schiedti]|nr:hypothetical protein Pelo_8679 [Pelomyxa schiedti]
MATRVRASAVFPLPIDRVWAHVRDFTFPRTLIQGIEVCEMADGAAPTTVGAMRNMRWVSGEARTHRLLGLSDQFYTVSWELVASEPHHEITGAISTLQLHRITETEQTLVEWSCDFSSDVTPDFIQFEKKAYLQNLLDMRTAVMRT